MDVQREVEGTAVSPAGLTTGDLIHGQIPTDYSRVPAVLTAPATPV